jgi:tight adherence protein B
LKDEGEYLRQSVARLGSGEEAARADSMQDARAKAMEHPLSRAFMLLPGSGRALPALTRAGLIEGLPKLLMFGLLVFFAMLLLTSKMKLAGVFLSLAIAVGVVALYVRRRVRKSRDQFVQLFPDALDIIVRSVRSGYPLNTALAIVAENLPEPVSGEFKRIVNEVTYGWTLQEALNRFRERMRESDVDFFVTVLSVQQECGGNLSEVLGNLSKVLRSRKHLRLKIKALSSEGRVTAWVLGSLPVLVVGAVSYMAPGHFDPMLNSSTGNIIIAVIVAMMATGAVMIKRIINIDI